MASGNRLGRRHYWAPIQAGYAPKPWWKFDHLQRFDRVLRPIYERFYPVGADVVPPADMEALAQWMQRWRLLPSRMPLATAQRQLESLAFTPAEIVKADGIPAQQSNKVRRLPAEWEPTEAVIITWPVLYPGLWDFHRDLVAALAPVARVDVLVPHAIYAAAILVYLGEGSLGHRQVRFLVTASDDIWIRDYGPLTCFDTAGHRVVVDAIFDPPPAMPFANDDAFPVRYAAHEGLSCRHLPLHLEGGNLWSDGCGTLITTERLFARNFPMAPDELRHLLLEGLGAETLIVLPPLRTEDTGHVDVFVKLATEDTVLVTEPGSASNRLPLAEAARVFGASHSTAGYSYRVVALPGVPPYRNWGVSRVCPSYANALTVNGRVLVPTYRDQGHDTAALAVYRQVMPDHDIIGIDARIAANAGGTVHCLTMQVPADITTQRPR